MEHFPLSLHSFSPFLRLNLIVLYLSKQGMEAVLITRNSTTDNQGNLTTSDQRLEVNLAGKGLPLSPLPLLEARIDYLGEYTGKTTGPRESIELVSVPLIPLLLSLSLSLY